MTKIVISPRILSAAEKLAGLPQGEPPKPVTISTAGLYPDFTERDYHLDPCPEPSASRSVIKDAALKTMRHAFISHPRLNPKFKQKEREDFDLGTAAHTALLTRGKAIYEVQAKDWRTDAAKAARDAARLQGMTPILSEQLTRVRNMIAALAEQLPDHGLENLFADGKGGAEVMACAIDPVGGWSRCLIDWLEKDTLAVTDYKTTAIDDFSPEGLGRHCAAMFYDVQHAFYERILTTLFPQLEGRFQFRFLFQEDKEPHAILPIVLPNDAIARGRAIVAKGMERWARAKMTGKWPRYSGGDVVVEYPPWSVAEFA